VNVSFGKSLGRDDLIKPNPAPSYYEVNYNQVNKKTPFATFGLSEFSNLQDPLVTRTQPMNSKTF